MADILIVADQSDLNIYKSADKDDMDSGTKVGCCGPGSAKKSPCCSGGDGMVGEEEDGKWKDVDFNEWAGEHSFIWKEFAAQVKLTFALGSFKIYAIKPADDENIRVI